MVAQVVAKLFKFSFHFPRIQSSYVFYPRQPACSVRLYRWLSGCAQTAQLEVNVTTISVTIMIIIFTTATTIVSALCVSALSLSPLLPPSQPSCCWLGRASARETDCAQQVARDDSQSAGQRFASARYSCTSPHTDGRLAGWLAVGTAKSMCGVFTKTGRRATFEGQATCNGGHAHSWRVTTVRGRRQKALAAAPLSKADGREFLP